MSTETEWRKAIADQVRRNCTPSSDAYARGGDFIVREVADWIENPPEWSTFEAPGGTGAADIADERARQVVEEGYDAEHDRGHAHQLMAAAMCYLTVAAHPHPSDFAGRAPISWPWAERFWKPAGGRVRNLVKAGALIAAAIDSMKAGF